MKIHLGLDIGSISINTAILDGNKNIIETRYTYCQGKPFDVLKTLLSEIITEYGLENIDLVAITGTGGQQAVEQVGGEFVNEIIAQSTAVGQLYPEANTVIEMGGEDSKLIFMQETGTASSSQLSDFAMNSLCAAGTGSFLDQQAKRIGVSIEKEFGNLALRSKKPPRIAGRCSVFAKSDMIHLQQVATPLHDIVAGLCFAVARNFKSTLGRGKNLKTPILFQGGVAANVGMVRAFREILEVNDKEFIIPEHYASMGAIGALYHIFKKKRTADSNFRGIDQLQSYLTATASNNKRHEKLVESEANYYKEIKKISSNGPKIVVSLGVDVGSLSTNLVLIDQEDNVIARRYLPTASKPLNAIQRGLKEIYEEVGDHIEVKSVGATGSGRYLTGDFIGADTIQNEITAQATAAITHDPSVDTIFEIGGQDSKYISIENGVIVDFEMNKVCAAGTGSFLEEQAEKLDINIKEEFGALALGAEQPVKLGSRCTVFMDTDLNSHQQKGAAKDDLVGGLAYSIVQNYIQKVVGIKPVGEKIFFQGGVTNNKSVVAAFEKVTGKPMIIPPHFDVTGAIGVAILARKAMGNNGHTTKFKGFEVYKLPFTLDSFPCKRCTNYCEIQRVRVDGEKKGLFYGGRCDRYDIEERKGKGEGIPNYFEERTEILIGDYVEQPRDKKISIGIPRGLMLFYQQFPFWRTFFDDLGFRVVVSEKSDQQTVRKSLELMVAETCLPVEMIHGHVYNLHEKGVDYIFTPFVVDAKAEKNNPTNNCNCPWVQSYPFMLKSAFADDAIKDKLLIPTLHFRYFGRVLNNELAKFMKEQFGIARAKVVKAIKKADAVQVEFENEIKRRGQLALASIPEGKKGMVILGRPYNTSDPLLNLRLVEKLINLETVPLPVDYLPVEEEDIFEDYSMMYWPNSQKIVSAGRIIRKNKNLFGVYLGNFRCGPDTFITHYIKEEMQGKPFLHLEIDEHSADAGMITRLEAFLDSLEGYQKVRAEKDTYSKRVRRTAEDKLRGRTLYYPYARENVHALAAATRSIGIDSEVLPMVDEKDLEIARKLTNGQECFPAICTTGTFVRKLQEPGADPGKMAFFMPDHNGPCRFGHYNKLHRIVFDRLGFDDAELITPSNDDSYAALAPGKAGTRFRMNAWQGIVAIDMLKKMLQEKRPYEVIKGNSKEVYDLWLVKVLEAVENNCRGLVNILEQAGEDFSRIPFANGERKPIIAIVGEVFMRDNPFCCGFVEEKLESLGAETIQGPFAEWVNYSTIRYSRDSIWRGDLKGLFKSRLQQIAQKYIEKKLHRAVSQYVELEREIPVKEMFRRTDPYVHHDYDGDPVASLGGASGLYETGISGVAHIMPFTCMPGTLIAAVTNQFRKDHNNLPWENIPYEGQEDSGLDTRLQAFMHQAKEYRDKHNLGKAMRLQKETALAEVEPGWS